MLIDRKNAVLVLIDVQENLTPVVSQPRAVIDGCARLARGAGLLKVPVVATEQYPKGLGNTIFDVRRFLDGAAIVEKQSFSAFKEPSFVGALEKTGKKQVVLAGIEAHVCVLQTAFDLKNAGYSPFVVIDACSSRHAVDFETAKNRLVAGNIPLVTTEMALYEWLETAKAPEFKECHTHLLY